MKALVMSDSHGDRAGMQFIVSQARQRSGRVDAYIHLGDGASDFLSLENFFRGLDSDCAMWQVRGNCDFSAPDVPLFRVVPFGGTQLYLTHGHRQMVKSTLAYLDEEAQGYACSIALFGHTHQPDMEMGRVLKINPGSIQDGRIAFLEVSEGRPRVQLWRFA